MTWSGGAFQAGNAGLSSVARRATGTISVHDEDDRRRRPDWTSVTCCSVDCQRSRLVHCRSDTCTRVQRASTRSSQKLATSEAPSAANDKTMQSPRRSVDHASCYIDSRLIQSEAYRAGICRAVCYRRCRSSVDIGGQGIFAHKNVFRKFPNFT